jgi:hypothetical protein
MSFCFLHWYRLMFVCASGWFFYSNVYGDGVTALLASVGLFGHVSISFLQGQGLTPLPSTGLQNPVLSHSQHPMVCLGFLWSGSNIIRISNWVGNAPCDTHRSKTSAAFSVVAANRT